MEKSLFRRNLPKDPAPTPYELIEPEIVHLKKGYSIRYGPKGKKGPSPWVVGIAFCGLAWLYLMDPIIHAWYKGEAIRTYLYLHNYDAGPAANNLLATQLFTPDEVNALNRQQGSFQDYYSSPQDAERQAQTMIDYLARVRLLHEGKYETLDPVGRMRYALFIYPGILLPTDWSFLDPSVGS